MKQIARNLTDVVDGFLRDTRYLILDRDPLYTAAFRKMLKDSGVEPLRLPARSPNLNAYAERYVLSAKRECLNRIVPGGVLAHDGGAERSPAAVLGRGQKALYFSSVDCISSC